MEKQRLDKFISNQLVLTRSTVKNGIRCGGASVNGVIIRNPAFIVDAVNDRIEYNGTAVAYKKHIYIMMNKPAGLLSASNDKNRKTVIDIVPAALSRKTLFPVGRLDKDTTGLLIITDDGEFAHNCISPSKEVNKTYVAGLDGEVTAEMCEVFKNGVVLADGTRCKPALLKPLRKQTAEITIFEGKYHQIKRMFGVVGLGVKTLHRCSIGELRLPENLKSGECIELSEEQLEKAQKKAQCAF